MYRRLLPILLLPLAAAVQADEALSDPLRPSNRPLAAAPAGERGPSWRLESTLIGPQRSLAVINGQSLAIGGSVDGATLLQIAPGRVLLQRSGRTFELTLAPADIKQPRD